MTRTAERLERLGLPHARGRVAAVLLMSLGGALAIAALGMRLAPGAIAIVACWVAILLLCGAALWAARRARRSANARVMGHLAEHAGGVRAGSVLGALPQARAAGASTELFNLADERAAGLVSAVAPRVHRVLARGTRRRVALGAGAAVVGALLFLAAFPARSRAAFWHPLKALADAHAPVRLEVSRDTVRRGETVTVTIAVPAATRATLWIRGPGEPWRPLPVRLDAAGSGVRQVGPLESDLFLRATSGSRRSAQRKVAVAMPAFIAELGVVARFPAYLGRDEQPLAPGPDTVPLPEGTALLTTGVLSVRPAAAAWTGANGAVARLAIRGAQFNGAFVPRVSGSWRLEIAVPGATRVEGEAPELHLRIVPDSAPVVAVAVPAHDTTLPISLRQPIVIDARDDHAISRVEIVSWRVSRSGKIGAPVRQGLDASGAGERALVQGELDAERRGLLPGDTLRFRVEAWDNAPAPHKGQSPEIALRLPSLEDLRAATRAATRGIATAADSLVADQSELSQRTRDLAQERMRDEAGGGGAGALRRAMGAQPGALPFEASERAAAIERQQTDLEARARRLTEQVEQVARAAQAAGLNDSVFQARLSEIRQLLQRAVSPELEQRLRELREALQHLDPDATRNALQHLAEAQRQLRDELERSRDLFRRAAVEGTLASLAADAEELRQRQHDWNRSDAPRPDTAAAARESALSRSADSLARGIAALAADLTELAGPDKAQGLADPQAAAERGRAAMSRAAAAAAAQRAQAAASAGALAESSLAVVAPELLERRNLLDRAWKQETLDALDRALAEAADLVARQQTVADSLHKGTTNSATRSQQASVEQGTAAVEKQIRAAAGRHALVSPQLERALGFAQRQMRATQDELEEADPAAESAATLADQSVDALNATVLALLRSRSDVAGAKSGSGFAEAMEQLAQLARQQSGVNGQTEGLLPMSGDATDAMLEQLRNVAAQQRALANQLDRMRAEGANEAAGALANEARDIAAQLDQGRVDPQTVRRQSVLYHRLLDAGRTLEGSDPDPHKERTSEAAAGDSVHTPGRLLPGAAGVGPRVRYPTWDELRELTPDQRRLVLEYFRRLNTPEVPH